MSRNYLNRNSLSSDTTNIHNNSKLAYYLTHALLKNFKLQIIVTPLCVKWQANLKILWNYYYVQNFIVNIIISCVDINCHTQYTTIPFGWVGTSQSLKARLVHGNSYYIVIGISIISNIRNWNDRTIPIHLFGDNIVSL